MDVAQIQGYIIGTGIDDPLRVHHRPYFRRPRIIGNTFTKIFDDMACVMMQGIRIVKRKGGQSAFAFTEKRKKRQ